jgi:hypothetical protein
MTYGLPMYRPVALATAALLARPELAEDAKRAFDGTRPSRASRQVA